MPMIGSLLTVFGIHRIPFVKSLNDKAIDAFKSLDVTDANFRKLGLPKGQVFAYQDKIYQIVRARGALVAGGLVKPYIGGTGRTGTLASSTAAVSTTASSFGAVGELVDGYMFTTGGTGPNQLRQILNNDATAGASTITIAKRDNSLQMAATAVPDAWGTVPDSTTTFSIFLPWEVTGSTAITDRVRGVSLGTVTSGNWTIVQVVGPALVLSVGSTDALIAGQGLYPSATANTAKGRTAAGLTAQEAELAFGYAIDAYSGAAALRLCWVDCRRHAA